MSKYNYIIYNCGYYLGIKKDGPVSGKQYKFKKRMITEVDEKDGRAFCKMTSDDIQWCDRNDKKIPPFMTAKDWCDCKEGTFTRAEGHIYDYDKYLNNMLL